jgi:hypothetical protein
MSTNKVKGNGLMIRTLALTLLLFAATSNAAIVTVNGTNVKFTYDDATLYGAGNVVGNTIFFTPTTFKAESTNGIGLVQTSESLGITVEALSGSLVMSAFQLVEDGDYKLDGVGTSVSAVGSLTIASETNANSTSAGFDAGALTTPGGPTAWSAGTTLFLNNTAGWNTDTKVLMTLNNTLSATSLNAGEQALIEKKFGGTAIGLTIDLSPVPVPAAAWLFGSALGLLGWMRRKTSR